ncbi:MAG: HDOD domain-containing protein [Pseudomonadota bacterium]
MSDFLISRQILINRQNKVIATRLTLHLEASSEMTLVAQWLNDLLELWPQGEKLLFVCFALAPTTSPSYRALLDCALPENIILELPSTPFVDADSAEFVAALVAKQWPLCLSFDEDAGRALARGLSFRFIDFDAQRFNPEQLAILTAKTQAYGIALAHNVAHVSAFKACLDAGVSAAAGWFLKHPETPRSKTLSPEYTQIINVLNLVREGADVKQVESALKNNVTLSYKLLRYINSAGFGLSCEIQSFRHAVSILGYAQLNKWLSLLLATASKDPMAPALMYAALTRARLMELLGHGLVDAEEYDNLFIIGAFSLLDVLLGVDMEQVLDAMNLPDSVADALLGKAGCYTPFLQLAIACEAEDTQHLSSLANSLGVSPSRLNQAHLEALVFAANAEE